MNKELIERLTDTHSTAVRLAACDEAADEIERLEGSLSDAFIHGYWSAEADNDTACSEKRRKHWKRFKAALDKEQDDGR